MIGLKRGRQRPSQLIKCIGRPRNNRRLSSAMTHQGLFASVPTALPQLPLNLSPQLTCGGHWCTSTQPPGDPHPHTQQNGFRQRSFWHFKAKTRTPQSPEKVCGILITVPILLPRKMGLVQAIICILPKPQSWLGVEMRVHSGSLQVEGACGLQTATPPTRAPPPHGTHMSFTVSSHLPQDC